MVNISAYLTLKMLNYWGFSFLSTFFAMTCLVDSVIFHFKVNNLLLISLLLVLNRTLILLSFSLTVSCFHAEKNQEKCGEK